MIDGIRRPTEYQQQSTGYRGRKGEQVTDHDEMVYCLAEDVRQYAEDMEAELREAVRLLDCEDIFVSAEQKIAWRSDRDDFLDRHKEMMAERDTNSTIELCQDERPSIPDGVPVWVNQSDDIRIVRVSAGNGCYYAHGHDDGLTAVSIMRSETMRPVCFPDWDKVPEWVACIELSKINGVWLSCFRQEVWDLGYGTYYEVRPI